MVGMPEIVILDVGMGDKILALVCWNLMCFFIFWAGKLLPDILLLRKNARKTFT